MSVNLRKPLVATAIVGGILAVSGTAAFAYWTATGTGSGTASTAATSNNLTITQAAFAGTALVPGGTAQTISGTIGNTNTFPAPVTSFTAVTNLTTASTVPAAGSSTFTGKIQLTDEATNQDACKGATVTLSYSVS
jgi:hypothetical protein